MDEVWNPGVLAGTTFHPKCKCKCDEESSKGNPEEKKFEEINLAGINLWRNKGRVGEKLGKVEKSEGFITGGRWDNGSVKIVWAGGREEVWNGWD